MVYQSTMPATNGTAAGPTNERFIDGVDPDDPDYQRQLMRPAEIKEDVKLMEQRKRVSLILKSAAFRKDLEGIVSAQLKAGESHLANLVALQQISDMLLPQAKLTISSAFTKGATMPVIPINDLRGSEAAAAGMTKVERLLRCKLAAAYRLIDIHGWSTGIGNHATVRISRDSQNFLINPIGLLFHEITASSLVKVDIRGEVLEPGTTVLGVDKSGWVLHSAIHSSRPDLRCVIHLNTPAAVAISCMPHGLLPISQEGMILGEIGYYVPGSEVGPADDGASGDLEREAREAVAREQFAIGQALGPESKVLFVRNYGLLACGESVEEAWVYGYNAMEACEAQLRLSCLSLEDLILPSDAARKQAYEVGKSSRNIDMKAAPGAPLWRCGELEFEAMMRQLDAAGYRTGYIYRLVHLRSTGEQQEGRGGRGRQRGRHASEGAATGPGGALFEEDEGVEIPPATSSFATAYYGDEETRLAAAAAARQKSSTLQQTHWLNTPNIYHREDISHAGMVNAKIFTRWVADEKQTGSGLSTAVLNPNQFAPQGGNPREFREQQKKVKSKYYQDEMSAGPSSKVMDGMLRAVAETETAAGAAATTTPASTAAEPGPEPGHIVVVGSASMGIIQRDHRHDPGVYQAYYSPNPFDGVTDEEIERYKRAVERKQKGLPPIEQQQQEPQVAVKESKPESPPPPAVTVDKAPEIVPQIASPVQASTPYGRPVESAPPTRPSALTPAPVMQKSTDSSAEQEAEKDAPSSSGGGATLSPGRVETMRSDTSGAEASHDDTEKDQPKEGSPTKDKKKRKFKMPSFSRKSKEKEKDKHK